MVITITRVSFGLTKMGEYNHLCRLSFVGDPGVGKSSLVLRYVDDFIPNWFISTIGVDFRIRTINLAGFIVKLQLWDISGQDRFKTVASHREYRRMDGIILVYDCTEPSTFKNCDQWMIEIERYSTDAKVILIGNKCDLSDKRKVSTVEGRALAEKLSTLFAETSAIESTNVECAITSVIYEALWNTLVE